MCRSDDDAHWRSFEARMEFWYKVHVVMKAIGTVARYSLRALVFVMFQV
jgi:hypothetical protein